MECSEQFRLLYIRSWDLLFLRGRNNHFKQWKQQKMCSKSLGCWTEFNHTRMDGTKSSSLSYFWRTSCYQGDEKLCEVKEEKVADWISDKNLTELLKMWVLKQLVTVEVENWAACRMKELCLRTPHWLVPKTHLAILLRNRDYVSKPIWILWEHSPPLFFLPRVIAQIFSLWKSKVRYELIAESETAVTLK